MSTLRSSFIAVVCLTFAASGWAGELSGTSLSKKEVSLPDGNVNIVIAGFSLIGVPMTVGFVSKWTLISALFDRGLWPLAVLVLLGSLLAVIYIWRVVEAAYFRPRPEGAEAVAEAPLAMLLPLWLLVAASVYFGLDTSLTLDTAERAAGLLLGALG